MIQYMKNTKTIDITPTWEGILPSLLELLKSPSAEARGCGIDELTKMARIADGAKNPRKGTR